MSFEDEGLMVRKRREEAPAEKEKTIDKIVETELAQPQKAVRPVAYTPMTSEERNMGRIILEAVERYGCKPGNFNQAIIERGYQIMVLELKVPSGGEE